jgi:hypothetical protein
MAESLRSPVLISGQGLECHWKIIGPWSVSVSVSTKSLERESVEAQSAFYCLNPKRRLQFYGTGPCIHAHTDFDAFCPTTNGRLAQEDERRAMLDDAEVCERTSMGCLGEYPPMFLHIPVHFP